MSEIWEERAQWWRDTFAAGDDPEYRDQIIPLVQENLGPARTVVDVGCGEGQLARAAQGAGARVVVGFDGSFAMCAEAKERSTAVAQTRASVLPIADGSADAVIVCLVLEHVVDAESVAAELSRILRPGGRLLLFLNHPFMQTPGSGWIEDHVLEERYWRLGPYLREAVTEEEVEPGVKIPFNHRPMSSYVNMFTAQKMFVTKMVEPAPPDEYIENSGEHDDASTIPRMLFLRFEKLT